MRSKWLIGCVLILAQTQLIMLLQLTILSFSVWLVGLRLEQDYNSWKRDKKSQGIKIFSELYVVLAHIVQQWLNRLYMNKLGYLGFESK